MIPASLLDHNSRYAVEASRQQRRDTAEKKKPPTEGGYTTSRLCSSDETCFKLINVPTICLLAAALSPFFLHHRPSKKAATQPSIATVPGFANSKTTGGPPFLPSLRLHSQAMFPQLREGNTNPRTKKPTKGDVSCSHCPGGEFLDLHCEREGMRSAKSSDICSVTSDRIPSAHPARAYPPVAPVRPRSLSTSVPPCVPLLLSS